LLLTERVISTYKVKVNSSDISYEERSEMANISTTRFLCFSFAFISV